MKYSFILFVFLFLISCKDRHPDTSLKKDTSKLHKLNTTAISTKNRVEVIEPAFWDTIFVQDLNHDAIADTAFVFTKETLKVLDSNGDLMYSYGFKDTIYHNRIKFSCALPELIISRSIWANIENVGDLNHDGNAEVIVSPGWFTSCWGRLYLYSYQKSDWKKLAEVTSRICTDTPLKSNVIRISGKYYLKGLKFEDGNDVEYRVRIKI